MTTRVQFIDEYTNGPTSRDLLAALIGRKIGEGYSRVVFQHATDPKLVVKIETISQSFCNVTEWETWLEASDTKIKKWLAPVEWISPCGIVLLQRKTKPVVMSEMPERIPKFMEDLKLANWGRIGKRVVCHDYGNTNAIKKGITGGLKKAKWWDE